jgi:hypothetical protein
MPLMCPKQRYLLRPEELRLSYPSFVDGYVSPADIRVPKASHLDVAKYFPSGENSRYRTKASCAARSCVTSSGLSSDINEVIRDLSINCPTCSSVSRRGPQEKFEDVVS